jgi:DNA polymerase III psi subunit
VNCLVVALAQVLDLACGGRHLWLWLFSQDLSICSRALKVQLYRRPTLMLLQVLTQHQRQLLRIPTK